MRLRKSILFGFLMLFVAVPAAKAQEWQLHSEQEILMENWEPKVGDRFVVDTASNMGYLVHPLGEFTSFPVATGQKRWVYYVGRSYFAGTPERTWVAKSKEYKGKSTTFGEEGLFLRLFYKDESTLYGIHAYLGDRMHDNEDRYRSMGCIVPRHSDLAVIAKTFDVNEGELVVVTKAGINNVYDVAFEDNH